MLNDSHRPLKERIETRWWRYKDRVYSALLIMFVVAITGWLISTQPLSPESCVEYCEEKGLIMHSWSSRDGCTCGVPEDLTK